MSEVKPAPAPAAAPVKKEKKDKKASKKPAATEAQYPLEVNEHIDRHLVDLSPFDTWIYIFIDDSCSRVSSVSY